MTPEFEQNPYFENIARIINFFRHTPESGFLFCVCNSFPFVQEINREVIEKAKNLGLTVRSLYISSDDTDLFLQKIREAAQEKPGGIILNNLDELILMSEGEIISQINFAREILAGLGVPLLFWMTERNVARFANKASDFFIRRDRSVITFSEPTGFTSLDKFDDFIAPINKTSENYQKLKLRIELLEKQLKEAEERGFSEKRIALEIAVNLIEVYLEGHLRNEAWGVFEKYGQYIEESKNVKHLVIVAELHHDIGKWDKALEYFFKSEQIILTLEDQRELGDTYNKIGLIYLKKGEFNKVLEYYLKSEHIFIKYKNYYGLAHNYNNTGLYYSCKNELDNAIEYFMKSKDLFNSVNNLKGLGRVYNNIGFIYFSKYEFDKSLEYYLKAETIRLETGDLSGLGSTYNNIGFIYFKKGEWDKSLEYYLKDEKLSFQVGDPRGIAYSSFFFSQILKKKSFECILLAGYLAKTLGMNHELSEWQSELQPIIDEMGEEHFMAEGRRLYEEKLKAYQVGGVYRMSS